MMDEREQAVRLANAVLNNPHIDPDGDICVLARQFLRAIGREQKASRDQAQRESWVRAMMPTGDPRFD